jgi:hypothetical protein
LKIEIDLVNACDIDATKLSRELVYDIAGQIVADPLLTTLAQNKYLATRHQQPVHLRSTMKIGTRAQVIREMSETERAALRSRVMLTGPTAQLGANRVEVR